MFSFKRLSTVLQQTLDVVAPKLITRAHEMQDHYKTLVLFEEDVKKRSPQEVEGLSEHFSVMQHVDTIVKLMAAEDESRSKEPESCSEFFIDKRVFELLASIAVHEKAPNLTKRTLIALTALIKLKFNWMAHSGACKAMINVVDTLQMRGPSENFAMQLMTFMYSLCEKFYENPSLQNFFYDPGGSPQFSLFCSLLQYIDTANEVGKCARKAVSLCLQCNDPDFNNYIEHHSGLIERSMRILIAAFSRCVAGITINESDRPVIKCTPFFSSLIFLDDICRLAHVDIVMQALRGLEDAFFFQTMRPEMAAASEVNAVGILKLLRCGMSRIRAPALRAAYIRGLVGCDFTMTRSLPHGSVGCDGQRFVSIIISNIDSMNDQLAVATMQLVLSLFDSCNYDMFHTLLRNEMIGAKQGEIVYSALKERYESLFAVANCGIVPGPCSQKHFGDYTQDAAQTCAIMASAAQLWVHDPAFALISKADTLDPSPFLSVLYQRLDRCLENSLEVNLLLTGILARITMLPNENITFTLLNPGHSRCLYHILARLSDEVEKRAARMEGQFASKLDATRIVLKQPKAPHSSANITTLDDYEGAPLRSFLQAIVVLEEFKAELLAVIHVKHQLSMKKIESDDS